MTSLFNNLKHICISYYMEEGQTKYTIDGGISSNIVDKIKKNIKKSQNPDSRLELFEALLQFTDYDFGLIQRKAFSAIIENIEGMDENLKSNTLGVLNYILDSNNEGKKNILKCEIKSFYSCLEHKNSSEFLKTLLLLKDI